MGSAAENLIPAYGGWILHFDILTWVSKNVCESKRGSVGTIGEKIWTLLNNKMGRNFTLGIEKTQCTSCHSESKRTEWMKEIVGSFQVYKNLIRKYFEKSTYSNLQAK